MNEGQSLSERLSLISFASYLHRENWQRRELTSLITGDQDLDVHVCGRTTTRDEVRHLQGNCIRDIETVIKARTAVCVAVIVVSKKH
jgi:hypothetical protein